jgi:hypothetical protein
VYEMKTSFNQNVSLSHWMWNYFQMQKPT